MKPVVDVRRCFARAKVCTAITGLAGKISKERTEPDAVAPELPLRAL